MITLMLKCVTPEMTDRDDAFNLYIRHSTHREEWGTKHPDRGARFLARMSRGAAPKTPGYDGALSQRPR